MKTLTKPIKTNAASNRGYKLPRYDWESWFSRAKKRPVRLCKGKDYRCMDHSMAIQLRTAAGARNIKLSVRYISDGCLEIVNQGRKSCRR